MSVWPSADPLLDWEVLALPASSPSLRLTAPIPEGLARFWCSSSTTRCKTKATELSQLAPCGACRQDPHRLSAADTDIHARARARPSRTGSTSTSTQPTGSSARYGICSTTTTESVRTPGDVPSRATRCRSHPHRAHRDRDRPDADPQVAAAVVDTFEPTPGAVELVGYSSLRTGVRRLEPDTIYQHLRAISRRTWCLPTWSTWRPSR
jgi:hypothetical protein